MIGNVWEWTTDWYVPRHPAEAIKACCIPHNPRGRPRGRELRSGQPGHPDPAQGAQGRVAPLRAELLPPLPAGRAFPGAGGHLDQPRRLPLHRARAGRAGLSRDGRPAHLARHPAQHGHRRVLRRHGRDAAGSAAAHPAAGPADADAARDVRDHAALRGGAGGCLRAAHGPRGRPRLPRPLSGAAHPAQQADQGRRHLVARAGAPRG